METNHVRLEEQGKLRRSKSDILRKEDIRAELVNVARTSASVARFQHSALVAAAGTPSSLVLPAAKMVRIIIKGGE